MNSPFEKSTDLDSPLPTRQFRPFLLFFHTVYLVALAVIYYAHCHRGSGGPGLSEALLGGLVLLQILLYLLFFAVPSLIVRPTPPWLPAQLADLATPPAATEGQSIRWWWWGYLVASVVVVLGECRFEPDFGPFLIAYIGQLSVLPFRQSVPATLAIFAAYLLNRFGWSGLMVWDAGDWLGRVLAVAPFAVLILFLGRIMVTSAERGRLIVQLEAAKRELEAARLRDAELAALRERERLARELHDTLGHAVATLTVQLEAAQRLVVVDPPRAGRMLEEMQQLTRSSMADLRRSLANLRTPGLGDRPLGEALRTLCAETAKRDGIGVNCRLAVGADSLPPAVAEALWRVVQEGLTNIEKHAHAQHVAVDLDLQPKEVVLHVSDDGVGLPSEAEKKPGHFGLRGLRERLEGLGGTLAVTPAGIAGTVIEARVPIIA